MKSLYKNKKDRMLFGVCAGLSDATGIDVTILRFATIFGNIFTGSLIFWVYLLLALILPNKTE